ncbi:MAG: PIG-L deacetylase family protein, partial [Acidimicrobiales bacterium]
MTVDLPTPRRALAVGAHPDDVEFGCGGTLAKWAAAGCEIVHLICTDGSKGSWDPAEDTATLVAVRQEEQRAASVALGGKGTVVFLGWRDGELESGLRQRAEVCYWIRRFRPDVVLGHDPWKR